MTVSCDFSVFLKDYEIEAPSLLAFIKVADEIKLNLNFTLRKNWRKIIEKSITTHLLFNIWYEYYCSTQMERD